MFSRGAGGSLRRSQVGEGLVLFHRLLFKVPPLRLKTNLLGLLVSLELAALHVKSFRHPYKQVLLHLLSYISGLALVGRPVSL
jgi:hypothetical protein